MSQTWRNWGISDGGGCPPPGSLPYPTRVSARSSPGDSSISSPFPSTLTPSRPASHPPLVSTRNSYWCLLGRGVLLSVPDDTMMHISVFLQQPCFQVLLALQAPDALSLEFLVGQPLTCQPLSIWRVWLPSNGAEGIVDHTNCIPHIGPQDHQVNNPWGRQTPPE